MLDYIFTKGDIIIKKLLLTLLITVSSQADSQPLQGREFGVEFNFPRLLTYSDSWKTASGTFSYFDHINKVEYAMPWTIQKHSNDSYDSYPHIEKSLDINTLDLHYRKFLGEELNGFYLSGFTRLAHLDGKMRYEDAYQKTTKLGLGAGLGYRLFPNKQRFYWGAGLIVGRYISGDNDVYEQSVDWLGFDDMPLIIDVEFLKFGYAF